MWSVESPCLNIAVSRLKSTDNNHFAVWVLQAPLPTGLLHHDTNWPVSLYQTWLSWQEIFSPQSVLPILPSLPGTSEGLSTPEITITSFPANLGYSSRLMQQLGLELWQWLFDNAIQNSLNQSKGVAIGQNQPLRLRLDIRDPDLIGLPWEIMQESGKPAIALNPHILFSRTTSDVEPLSKDYQPEDDLSILMVLGDNRQLGDELELEKEAAILKEKLESNYYKQQQKNQLNSVPVKCKVDTLLQPNPEELIANLERGDYNIFFYAGHGQPAPDGGLLLLKPNVTISGVELAQILVRCKVTLAVFNSCWGAQPMQENTGVDTISGLVPRSSLAEVLLHHGVPAVLAMRDLISDGEALSFIQAFTEALMERNAVDRAVSMARQHLLTLYKFNQPAWTLPVLYMHPEFNGQLLKSLDEITTELPQKTNFSHQQSTAYLRLINLSEDNKDDVNNTKSSQEAEIVRNSSNIWPINAGFAKVGRSKENDIVIGERWVSQKHAEIFWRNVNKDGDPAYFLKDFSRWGTLIWRANGWDRIHHQEVVLLSGTKLKFGSSHGQAFEFIINSNAKNSP